MPPRIEIKSYIMVSPLSKLQCGLLMRAELGATRVLPGVTRERGRSVHAQAHLNTQDYQHRACQCENADSTRLFAYFRRMAFHNASCFSMQTSSKSPMPQRCIVRRSLIFQ